MPTAPTRIKVIPRAISELNKAAVEEQTILQDYQRQKIYFATHALEIYFCRYSKARADTYKSICPRSYGVLFSYLSVREAVIVLNEKPLNLSHRHWRPGQEQFLVAPVAGCGLRGDP